MRGGLETLDPRRGGFAIDMARMERNMAMAFPHPQGPGMALEAAWRRSLGKGGHPAAEAGMEART